ncbi:MAG: M24 family metallopeptidase, partial [Bacteriovoracaceae bacterium]|nr:M24 family metallopeptidase [Bacteriovoracaceae bacterium]
LKSHFMIAEILKDFGFVNMPVDAMVEKGVTKTFYPHGLGHHLGLQVHDVGGTQKDRQGTQEPILNAQDKYLRSNRIVEENFVITMEPGLYFIDSLLSNLKKSENSSAINWNKVDAFRKYGGIRIEDDMLIQKSGHINLTRG